MISSACDNTTTTSFTFDPTQGFDFRDTQVIRDQNLAFDKMLKEHPVVRNCDGKSHTVFKHADVMSVILDDKTFSAQASKYLFVPHGLDEPKHSLYRQAIAAAFTDDKMLPLLPAYRKIAINLMDGFLNGAPMIDAQAFAFYYTARVQLALLGWDSNLDTACIDWTKANLSASLREDITQNIANAKAWNDLVYQQLNLYRTQQVIPNSDTPLSKVTEDILNIRINGNPMPDDEIASLIRNLNMGLVSSLAFNIGNCIHFLAENHMIKDQIMADPTLLSEALDEITRLHGCLVSSKRIATRDTTIGDASIKKGELVFVNWCSANRDPDVFSDPTTFKWGGDHSKHIMYGAGPHECVGIQSARVMLKIAMEVFLEKVSEFKLDPQHPPIKTAFPANGYAVLPIQVKC